EHLAHDLLSQENLTVLQAGHEHLMAMFDALAADQATADASDLIVQLSALLEAPIAEDQDVADSQVEAAQPEREALAETDSDNVVAFPQDFDGEGPAVVEQDKSAVSPPEEISLEEVPADLIGELTQDITVGRQIPASAAQAMRETPEQPTEVERIPALAELLSEDFDEEIIEIFFEEADEILESLEENIHQWSSEPANLLFLEHLLRGLHTLKGGARLSGLVRLGDATHQFESFLVEIQNQEKVVDDSFFNDVHARLDELVNDLSVVRKIVAGEHVEGAAEILAGPAAARPASADTEVDLQPPAARPVASPPAGKVAAKKKPVPAQKDANKTATVKLAAESTREAAKKADPPDVVSAEQRSTQEMVRVGSALLENLVNLAGESSIVRARVEQGMNDFTSALDEMETTIGRVREQLRRLEIETEAQILFRQDRPDGPTYDQFDPLEMDRYSQLQQLSRGLSESASDMLDLKETLLFKARESETLLLQQARINTELQEGLMRTRMVPFSRMLPRLRRIVRQVSAELEKDVEFHAYNAEGELDRNLLERMVPPLEHMLRNAVDHGIESREMRKNLGKPPVGRIDLLLSREGGDVVIEISDDGAGIDVETVRAKAVESGLMATDADLRDDEICQFVLAPGFSTAKSVTQISGRGVGMDVVHSEVKQLGGSIQIASIAGKGSRFIVRVPFTVSVNRALMVSVGDDLYAIPLNTIEGIVLLSPNELEKLYTPEENTFEYAGIPYRVRYLGHYLGREFRASAQQSSVPVVLVRAGDQAVAVHVDGVQGSREIVVKSLGPQFAGVGGISGATILGDGSVVVIIDLIALIRAQSGDGLASGARPLARGAKTTCVMVVDDSVTVRKVTSRLLERQGMEVIVAKDGIEAIALLQERRPDVMLLDIEMPRMDGFEVARQVRHDDRLSDLPIVMISSRTG
ncbi:MAG: chemotaxis protein CheW, partial [Gammaproteobacteria bacterium]|nr:chemotaxis protein CheW [Gammaproteobacteria bacterium]